MVTRRVGIGSYRWGMCRENKKTGGGGGEQAACLKDDGVVLRGPHGHVNRHVVCEPNMSAEGRVLPPLLRGAQHRSLKLPRGEGGKRSGGEQRRARQRTPPSRKERRTTNEERRQAESGGGGGARLLKVHLRVLLLSLLPGRGGRALRAPRSLRRPRVRRRRPAARRAAPLSTFSAPLLSVPGPARDPGPGSAWVPRRRPPRLDKRYPPPPPPPLMLIGHAASLTPY